MVGRGSVSGRGGGKKYFKPENPSARKRKKNEEEDKDIVILESSSSSSQSEPEEESDSGRERGEEEEDSDDEEIRLLFVEKVASRNGEKGAGKVGKVGMNNEKRVGGSSSKSSGKEIDKKKSKGSMKAVVEEEERRGKKEAKNLKKKEKIVIVEEEEEEEEDGKGEREEGWECKFPMNRVSKIMKDRDGSVRLAQEAIFLANKASEKFLELYCREAYACAFLDHKKQVSYDHLGPPVDWANIEKLAGAMKNLEQQRQSSKDPPSPPKNSAAQESCRPDISHGLKRQKAENEVPTSSNSLDVSFPAEFEYSSAPGKSSEESPPPSPLETVSGLKLMSLLQNMNMLSFEMISRRNTRQILKDLGDEPDDLDRDQKEPKVAADTTRKASEAKAETSTKYQSTART